MDLISEFGFLLMASGKNVMLVGAPGVGKTRLAIRLSHYVTECEPEVVTGRDGLTFDDLMLRFMPSNDGSPRLKPIPGRLLSAIVRSWAGILSGRGPCHLVFDEVNRVNVDLVLGEVLTAMDMEHRYSARLMPLNSIILDLASEVIGDDGRDRLRDVLGRFGGLVMPRSFRMLATMNIVDRAQLFRISYAVLRRFGMIYVPPLNEYEVSKDLSSRISETVKRSGNGGRIDEALKMLKGFISSDGAKKQLLRELGCASMGLGDIELYDTPTLVKLPCNELWDSVDRLSNDGDFEALLNAMAFIYGKADELGLELGYSPIVDSVKAFLVNKILGELGLSHINLNQLVDVAVGAFAIPQFGAVMPRLRYEALVGVSSHISTFRGFIGSIRDMFGKKSLSARLVGSYEYELPD